MVPFSYEKANPKVFNKFFLRYINLKRQKARQLLSYYIPNKIFAFYLYRSDSVDEDNILQMQLLFVDFFRDMIFLKIVDVGRRT